jgi:hypothetical protein
MSFNNAPKLLTRVLATAISSLFVQAAYAITNSATVTNNGDYYNNQTYVNAGEITNNGNAENGASFINDSTGIFNNNAYAGNNDIVINNGTFENNSTGKLHNSSEASYSNFGTINSSGKIVGNGAFSNSGTIDITGGYLGTAKDHIGTFLQNGNSSLTISDGHQNYIDNLNLDSHSGGTILLSTNNDIIAVSSSYTNSAWSYETGNSFSALAGVSGSGQIVSTAASPQQAISVNNGSYLTTNQTINFGTTHVGANGDSQTFSIENAAAGPKIQGAIQTESLNGNLNLSDPADHPISTSSGAQYGPLATGSNTGTYTLSENTNLAGSLAGSVNVVDNFSQTQTLSTEGGVYDYALAELKNGSLGTLTGTTSISGSSPVTTVFDTLNLGALNAHGVYSDTLTLSNVFLSSFQDSLHGTYSFSGLPNWVTIQSTSGSSFNLGAGNSQMLNLAFHVNNPDLGLFNQQITIALYDYNADINGYNSGNGQFIGDINLSITGSVVSEPGSIWLVGIAGLGLIATVGNPQRRNRLR